MFLKKSKNNNLKDQQYKPKQKTSVESLKNTTIQTAMMMPHQMNKKILIKIMILKNNNNPKKFHSNKTKLKPNKPILKIHKQRNKTIQQEQSIKKPAKSNKRRDRVKT